MLSRRHQVLRKRRAPGGSLADTYMHRRPRCGGIMGSMQHRDPERHPGVWRIMQVDSEWAGVLIAAGFVLMGLVSLPIAKWFFLGAVMVGVMVALVLRGTKSEPPQSVGLGSQPESAKGPEATKSSHRREPAKSNLSIDVLHQPRLG